MADSGWTVSVLKEYIDTRFADLRQMLDDRYAAQTKAVDDAFEARQTAMQTAREADTRAVQAALLAQKEQNDKGDLADEKRFDLLNELRTGVATKEQIEALHALIVALTSRVDKTEGHSKGISTGWVVLLGVVTIIGVGIAAVGAAVALFLAFKPP